MTMLDQLVVDVGYPSLHCALSDWSWQIMGYKRCPRRGSFFDRFVDRNVLNQENRLLQSLWIFPLFACTSAAMRSNSLEMRARLAATVVDETLSEAGKAPFGWADREHAEMVALGTIGILLRSAESAGDLYTFCAEQLERELSTDFHQPPDVWSGRCWTLFHQSPLRSACDQLASQRRLDDALGKVAIRHEDWLREVLSKST